MNPVVVHALPLLLLLVVSLVVAKQRAEQARRISVLGAGAALALRLGTSGIGLVRPDAPYIELAAGVHLLLAFVICALAPRRAHSPQTFARMLQVLAIGGGFLLSSQPTFLAFLWAASVGVTWVGLRQTLGAESSATRLFAIYQVPSVALFVFGALALEQGRGSVAYVALLVAIALRAGIIPIHSWLGRFVEEAPMGLVLAFLAPQLGVYAHFELLHGHLPDHMADAVAGVSAVSALVASVIALGQKRVRRGFAFLLISQSGLVAFGLESLSDVGWAGAVLTWLVLSLGMSAFALTLAALEARRGPLELGKSAGAPGQTPRLAAASLLAGLSTVGFPLTLGFVAEDLLVQGSVGEHPILGFGLVIITALNGISVVRIYFGLFTAGPHRPGELDVTRRELFVLTGTLVILVAFGLLPQILMGRL